jgi:Flp pilus assembly protein TadG
MIYQFPSRVSRRRATAAVEAAIILPVIMIFTAAIIDLGRMGKVADCVSNAARNGAQYGMANTTAAADTVNIRKAAITEMYSDSNTKLPGVTDPANTNPVVTATIVPANGTSYIKVTVSYTVTMFFGYFNVTNITRSVQMPMMPQ